MTTRAGLFLLVLLLSPDAGAATITGRVVDIDDGDSFTIRDDSGRTISVRVAEIDAPEWGQPFSDESRRMLSRLILNKTVRLDVQTTDRYGRIVARPHAGGTDVASEMVSRGGAWAFVRYLRDERLRTLETRARERRAGLWALPEAERMPPWEWRRKTPQRSAPTSKQEPASCPIKGNISSSGERIYHVPGQQHYDDTRISRAKGERWFCSEEEARAAGWRRARR